MTAARKRTGHTRPPGLQGGRGTKLALTSLAKEGCPIVSVGEEEKEPS